MKCFGFLAAGVCVALINATATQAQEMNVAHTWNEQVLEGIRNDFARPTVHARNLLHTSMAMYDAWVAYDDGPALPFFLGQSFGNYFCPFDESALPIPETPASVKAAQEEAISYAVFRIMEHRFSDSPDGDLTLSNMEDQMAVFGYSTGITSTDYINDGPAALGNYIAEHIIAMGLQDGANEANGYTALCYDPVNPNIQPELPGNPNIVDPNHWQAIELTLFIDQSGNASTTVPEFVGPEWGSVTPFALDSSDLEMLERDGCTFDVWMNPGPPVHIDTVNGLDLEDMYKWNFSMVSVWGSHLDPSDGVMWDISPAGVGTDGSFVTDPADFSSFYHFFEGGHNSPGHAINPVTGEPYAPNLVPRGDYTRAIAEFWADGPESETPPGHWFTLLNAVMDYPDFEHRWRGQGPVIDDLEYTIKAYLTLAGAMHDSAVATWSVKGYYDYIRPVSAIRYMADQGQSTDASLDNYSPAGIPLIPGYIEVVEEGDPLQGLNGEHLGKIKLFTWRGPDYIDVPMIDEAGVGWILAEYWWPYQRPSFVTPPFAGYVSGHSTFSRAAAEILTELTGSNYFPGGLGTWHIEQNEFLVFEDGPSQSFDLQWATYQDAANESALSRMWGGIHPPMDDGRGRAIGIAVAEAAFCKAESYVFPQWAMECGSGFLPSDECAGDFNGDGTRALDDLLLLLSAYGNAWTGPYDLDNSGLVGSTDVLDFLTLFSTFCD